MRFEKFYDPDYLLFPGSYQTEVNNQLRLRFRQNYRYRLGSGEYIVELNNSMPGGQNRFSKITLTSLQDIEISRQFSLRLRAFVGYIAGQATSQSLLYLSSGSSEDWIGNNWYAARGTLPQQWAREGHIHPAGGGNVRGYQITREYKTGGETQIASGNRLLSANVQFEVLSPLNPVFDIVPGLSDYFTTTAYLFFDTGLIGYSQHDDVIGLQSTTRTDAGIGILAELDLPGSLRKLGSFTVRFDFPLYLSKPPLGEDDFKFRWVMGIG